MEENHSRKTEPEDDRDSTDAGDALASEISRWLNSDDSDSDDSLPTIIIPDPCNLNRSHKPYFQHHTVPIGPYNSAHPHYPLAPHPLGIDKEKQRCLRLSVHEDDDSVNAYVVAMKALEERALACYDDVIEVKYTGDKFVTMLLLDGCFILEVSCRWGGTRGKTDIFGAGWSMPGIRNDLLKLGNQIPFFVLECLFNLRVRYGTIPAAASSIDSGFRGNRQALIKLLVDFLTQGKMEIPNSIYSTGIKHLLHLYYHCLVNTPKQKVSRGQTRGLLHRLGKVVSFFLFPPLLWKTDRSPQKIETVPPRTIPCATELQESGVAFKRKKSKFLLDVTFNEGVLEIPFLSIDVNSRSLFINLLTYEQYSLPPAERKLMSYANFMDCIAHTAKDVAVLQQEEIIDNKLPTDDDAVHFFSELVGCGSIDYEKHNLARLFEEVMEYCESDWNRHKAQLKSQYFGNPWSILSLIVALCLLALTVVQTIYTVYPYYYPRC